MRQWSEYDRKGKTLKKQQRGRREFGVGQEKVVGMAVLMMVLWWASENGNGSAVGIRIADFGGGIVGGKCDRPPCRRWRLHEGWQRRQRWLLIGGEKENFHCVRHRLLVLRGGHFADFVDEDDNDDGDDDDAFDPRLPPPPPSHHQQQQQHPPPQLPKSGFYGAPSSQFQHQQPPPQLPGRDDDDDDLLAAPPQLPSNYHPQNPHSSSNFYSQSLTSQQQQQQQQQQQGRRRGPPPPSQQNPYPSNNNNAVRPNHPPQFSSYSGPAVHHSNHANVLHDTNANNNNNNNGGLDLSQFDKDMIFAGLKRMYKKKILPLELASKYGHFHSAPMGPSDFDAKPMVLLLGQYSVGKTSFINYMLGRDFPGMRIGPEPTTDRFTAIMLGDADKVVPGAALCSQADRPFRGLSPFGNNFLSRFEGVEMENSAILRNITLVDTPGILSGQKQSIGRNYDYEQVMKWFAERADLIIIMFDAHKLDISDELKRVIEIMKPHQDKIRVVLNKADSISTQQLMRVYGALMWSLGKVMMTPEVCRVYMGSFWAAPLQNTDQATLLTQEKVDLFQDIAQLPQNAVMRRINELVKRARSVKVHAYIIHYLRKQLPYTWGKREKQRRLIDRLDREFIMCARRYELPRGDFPPLEPFRQALLEIKDLSEFPKLDKKMVKEMDKVFSFDIPDLLEKARQH